ncbi:MAG: Arc family DNA-binding protein [Planctomycetia bacterium]|nr:Arc family DNA-binding protein [Planctomycetia bacterium]
MSEKEVKAFSLRMPPDLYDRVNKIAKENGMTFTSFVIQLMREASGHSLESRVKELEKRVTELENKK